MVSDHVKRLRIGFQFTRMDWQHLSIAIETSKVSITESTLCSRNSVRHFPFTAEHWVFVNLPRLYGLLTNFCSASISRDCCSGAARLDRQSAGPSEYDASPHRSHLPEPPSRPLSFPLGLTGSQACSPTRDSPARTCSWKTQAISSSGLTRALASCLAGTLSLFCPS